MFSYYHKRIINQGGRGMARKIPIKMIMQSYELDVGINEMALSLKTSKHSIKDVLDIAKEKKITFKDIKDKNNYDTYQIFFPNKCATELLSQEVDYEYIHKELKKTGVTLLLLWEEYCDDCKDKGMFFFRYSKFCHDYSKFTNSKSITNHLTHKPGIIIENDWSGKTMKFYSLDKAIKVYLYVATCPYSQYSYVEACLDMKERTWLECNINMWEYFGGVTPRTVCDNLKTGVISHPRDGEIVLNQEYENLASYYSTTILPAPVLTPKGKPSVEMTVGKIATAIIARLRNENFTSFFELQKAVLEKLEEFNTDSFEKRKDSRKIVFFEEEKDKLTLLPTTRYEISKWIYARKVQKNCHVSYRSNFYSCHYDYVGKKVDLKISSRVIEIYDQKNRLQTHKLFMQYQKNQFRTIPRDLPEYFHDSLIDKKSIHVKASEVGLNTLAAIDKIFESVDKEEQAYNYCKATIGLYKKYGKERLEYACKYALLKKWVPRYRILLNILSNKLDIKLKEKEELSKDNNDNLGYLRNSDYYNEENKDDE